MTDQIEKVKGEQFLKDINSDYVKKADLFLPKLHDLVRECKLEGNEVISFIPKYLWVIAKDGNLDVERLIKVISTIIRKYEDHYSTQHEES